MPESWTGDIVREMHNRKITCEQIAEEMGVTKAYVSMLLNSKRKPPGIKDRIRAALDAIVARRGEG